MTERKGIAIIGAGASGLAAARALRKLGQNDVVVLEAGSSVGGKCLTMHHRGRTYELGATILTPAYTRVREIMAEYEVPWNVRASARFLDSDGTRLSPRVLIPPRQSWRDAARLPLSSLRVYLKEVRAQQARFPRLDGVPTSWFQSFSHWARQHDATPLLKTLEPWVTSFGYGFVDEVPAAYVFNYLCVMGVSLELHQTGFTGLWQRVAADYDVRLESRVTRVVRSADQVLIETSRGSFQADKVIVTCPFEDAAQFLDADEVERELFSQVKHMDYQVIVANTRDMPKSGYVFCPDNSTRARAGKPVFCYRRYEDSGVIAFYSYGGPDGLEGAEREVVTLVEKMGGRVTEILGQRSHRYFPHVSSQSMADGFYSRLEAKQGHNRTFYAGEIMSFSCMEPVVAYAEQLADRVVGAGVVQPADLPWSKVANDVLVQLGKKSA